MYTFAFYTILITLIISIFVKLNKEYLTDFISEKKEYFSEKIKESENIESYKKEEKKDNVKINTGSYLDFEKRGDFYGKKNFIDLSINEYNRAILEIKKAEDYKNLSEKLDFTEDKKRIFEKLYKSQNLVGDYQKAEKNILNLISVSQDENYLFELIRNKINQKDLEKAQLILNRVKNKNYKYNYYNFILNIDTSFELEQFEEQIKIVKDSVVKSGDENYKLKILALEGAITEFKTYRDSQRIHLYTLIGKALTNSFEFEISNKILWDVLREREDYRDARIIFAYNKIRQGEAEKGLNILIGAESIDSSKPEIQFYKAIAYEDMGDNVKAKHNFLVALKNGYEPKSQIFQKLGEIYYKDGEFGESIEFYKKMLSVNSEKIEYFVLPFEIAVEQQNYFETALKIAEWAKRRHPESAVANSILGYGYFLNGDNENAKINLRKAFEIDNNLARSYLYAGEISMQEGQVANALKQFEIAYQKDPNGKVGEKAIKFYNQLIK